VTDAPADRARAAAVSNGGLRRRQRSAVAAAVALATALSATGGLTGAPAAAASTAPMQRVVVSGGAGLGELVATVERAGGSVVAKLSLIGAVGADLPAGTVLPPGYLTVADRPLEVASAGSAAEPTAASTVRETLGLGAPAGEGRGVTVAVVDTGVQEVADLRGRVRHIDVTGTGDQDGYGHGTFVAGLIAGSGRRSGGELAGVAPRASILSVKVADDSGRSSLVRVLTGLQAVANDGRADVVNLSLASGSPLPQEIDPLTRALSRLSDRGVTVVVPAGNDGDRRGTLASPGIDPDLLTVGALDEHASADRDDDTVAAFSSRGGRGLRRPDVVAPGVSVLSTLARGSVAEAAQTRTDLPRGYGAASGTSFSTAVASGAAAVLLGERSLQPEQVKRLLRRTAYDAAGLSERRAAGAGGLDLAAARDARTPRWTPPADELAPPTGQERRWQAFIEALWSGDQAAAEAAWDRLGARQQEWAASLWAARSPQASSWTASMWAGNRWIIATGRDATTAEQWQSRLWAASNWAASNWAASNWAASNWAASNLAASNWATWTASNWAASNRAASNWAASNWAAESWR